MPNLFHKSAESSINFGLKVFLKLRIFTEKRSSFHKFPGKQLIMEFIRAVFALLYRILLYFSTRNIQANVWRLFRNYVKVMCLN